MGGAVQVEVAEAVEAVVDQQLTARAVVLLVSPEDQSPLLPFPGR